MSRLEPTKNRSMKITKELQDTVFSNGHIANVCFAANGNYYLNVHRAGDNKLYGRIDRKEYKNTITGKTTKMEKPIAETLITEIWDREQILAANATFKSTFISLSELTPDAHSALMDLARAEINKEIPKKKK